MLFDTFKELDRISSAFFSGVPAPAFATAPVNLYREDDRYVVEAELPGYDPRSIDVTVEGGLLTIRADRSHESEDRGERWLVRERSSASVMRRLGLGEDVDVDAIAADYHDGVLKVTLPVRADALPKKVQVALGAPSESQQAIGAGSASSEEETASPKAQPAHSVAS